jgi:NAD-dependent dihydropyrimidine dehydrogenase PreA subunit
MTHRIFIVFCSPGGATRHVAQIMEKVISPFSPKLYFVDLRAERDLSWLLPVFKKAGKNDCLFIGSPVYRNAAVPPLMSFIDALPQVRESYTVPFVTWGGVTSGVALWQMGQALQQKGFMLAGAAKILAVHSMMTQSDRPLGLGHPDAEDDKAVEQLAAAVYNGLTRDDLKPCPLDAMDYQPKDRGLEMKQKLQAPHSHIPKTIDEDKCTQCGSCLGICPSFAITMGPFPKIDDRCFDCLSCVRICPEQAIQAKIVYPELEKMLMSRAAQINESPLRQIFFQQ